MTSARLVENGATVFAVAAGLTMTGPSHATVSYTGFMELGELARLFAVSPATIRRRLKAQERRLYLHPGDQRLRVVKEDDIRAIFEIIPAPQRRREAGVREG
jgi:hypothetical protein